jgi:hypothetical protein
MSKYRLLLLALLTAIANGALMRALWRYRQPQMLRWERGTVRETWEGERWGQN